MGIRGLTISIEWEPEGEDRELYDALRDVLGNLAFGVFKGLRALGSREVLIWNFKSEVAQGKGEVALFGSVQCVKEVRLAHGPHFGYRDSHPPGLQALAFCENVWVLQNSNVYIDSVPTQGIETSVAAIVDRLSRALGSV